jgi:hypothetical protein
MLVKSPMKERETKQNRRKPAPKKKRTSGNKGQTGQGNHGRRTKKRKRKPLFSRVAPWKIIVGIIAVGGLGILYLNHLFATRKLLDNVQQMENKYQQVKRQHKKYKLKYERMIGPAEITKKAKELGFINGGPAEKIIKVPK